MLVVTVPHFLTLESLIQLKPSKVSTGAIGSPAFDCRPIPAWTFVADFRKRQGGVLLNCRVTSMPPYFA
jgi:hypothetical protein